LFKRFFVAFIASAVASGSLFAQKSDPGVAQSHGVPLRLVQTLAIPPTVKGNFDHFGIDLKRNRLFATPEDSKAVLVFDLSQKENCFSGSRVSSDRMPCGIARISTASM
jgi:hypothetical protein